jgi:hypothetical protein
MKELIKAKLRQKLNIDRDIVIDKRFYKGELAQLKKEIAESKILAAKCLIWQIKKGVYEDIKDFEFKVFSQFGDDGIIQYLINRLQIEKGREIFIEFGVEDYTEANTRFLLVNNNWKGLVIDGNPDYIESIRKDEIYWKYDLTAVHSFITRDNIEKIIVQNGFGGKIGILSIDIDGVDYWIWEKIIAVDPVIIIIEYNSIFGSRHAITVPYKDDFRRTKEHSSNLYWGASLKALNMLAQKKGFTFVGCNSNGNNAYFVKNEYLGNIKPVDIKTGYIESKFRESRDEKGRLTYISGKDRINQILDMPVIELTENRTVTIKELFYNGRS